MSAKVAFIGLDGATWTVFLPAVERGLMPALGSLMERGAWGELITSIPPGTAPGWPSLMTGKSPASHGVFGFRDIAKDRYRPPIINAGSIRSKMMWEIAGEAGKRVCVINFPITYPIRPVNGAIVAGFMTPPGADDYYQPRGLGAELDGFLETGLRPKDELTPEVAAGFLDEMFAQMETRYEFMLKMASREEWDLYMACFAEPDRVHHFLWKYLDTEGPDYDRPGYGAVREKIDEFHKKLDGYIGGLVGALGEDAYYLVASDHGFRAASVCDVNINRMLKKAGFLKSGAYSVKRMLYKNRLIRLPEGADELETPGYSPVDWQRTRAWAVSYTSNVGAVFVNLKGRFPYGCVEDGPEREAVIAGVAEMLSGIRRDGKPVVKSVRRKEEVYSGRFIDTAPDLTIELEDGYDVPVSLGRDLKAFGMFTDTRGRSNRSGAHDMKGVYIASGPEVGRNGRGGELNIEDMAPLALYLAGVPIPSDMDGNAPLGLMTDGYRESHPARYAQTGEYEGPSGGDTEQSEEDMVEAQLKGLGYM